MSRAAPGQTHGLGRRALLSSRCPLVLGSNLCAQGRAWPVAATNLSSGSAFLKNWPGPASSDLGLNQRSFGTSSVTTLSPILSSETLLPGRV